MWQAFWCKSFFGKPVENIRILFGFSRHKPGMLPGLVAPLQVLAQLHALGLNAKIVDAIDGDAFTSQASTARGLVWKISERGLSCEKY